MDIKSADKTAKRIAKQLDEACRRKGCMNTGDKVAIEDKYFRLVELIEAYQTLRIMQKEANNLLRAAEKLGETSNWNRVAEK